VILQVAEHFGITAQQSIHLRRPDRAARRARRSAALDPGDLEAKMFGVGDVEAIGRDEHHLILLQPERLFDQRIAVRMRFELSRAVDADGRVEKSIEAGIFHQCRQHGGAAV
jgi:hypothetical protein